MSHPNHPGPEPKPCRHRFPCRKCGGSGNVGYRRAGGVCFRCGGDGVNLAAYQDAKAYWVIKCRAYQRHLEAEYSKRIDLRRAEIRQKEADGETLFWLEYLLADLPVPDEPPTQAERSAQDHATANHG